ncbi:tRNA wybutosine-synthesizing protein, partial [Lipomyces oligophaga]|uniref:tRNA wybutosine-synthesizing protein n=1 Tax=Lipomyces oligophaga TaxID=45792 RepID=UPI0034CF2108
FTERKAKILKDLISSAPDLSPKGGPDVQILPLLELINRHPDLVTTSSCAGRTAVYLEGDRHKNGVKVGGKGNGGRWLFVSHEDVNLDLRKVLFGDYAVIPADGPTSSDIKRYVHFKFEPLILHILCANAQVAQKVLGLAIASGFRESGYNGNILAIRCSLRIDAPVGYLDSNSIVTLVSDRYLDTLIEMAHDRFVENKQRTTNFMNNIKRWTNVLQEQEQETKDQRRVRKRELGLKKKLEL